MSLTLPMANVLVLHHRGPDVSLVPLKICVRSRHNICVPGAINCSPRAGFLYYFHIAQPLSGAILTTAKSD